MNLGIVISAGGAAFEAAARIVARSPLKFTVVTDRKCDGELAAQRVGAETIRIDEESRSIFSQKVAAEFQHHDIKNCLLFFDRIVSPELFEVIETFNIHPAALPAFPGRDGIRQAHVHRARLLGCSLHRVDGTIDGGPLVAQIARGMDPDWPLSTWQKTGYLMKVYCALVWMSHQIDVAIVRCPINASHGLPDEWIREFYKLQELERTDVI